MSKEAIMEAAKQSIVEADEDMAMEALANAEAEGVDLVGTFEQRIQRWNERTGRPVRYGRNLPS